MPLVCAQYAPYVHAMQTALAEFSACPRRSISAFTSVFNGLPRTGTRRRPVEKGPDPLCAKVDYDQPVHGGNCYEACALDDGAGVDGGVGRVRSAIADRGPERTEAGDRAR